MQKYIYIQDRFATQLYKRVVELPPKEVGDREEVQSEVWRWLDVKIPLA